MSRGWRRPGFLLAAVAALIGLASLIEYVAGLDLHIDQLLMHDPLVSGSEQPGRMAPATALCFLMIGLSIVALYQQRPRVTIGTVLAVLVVAQAFAVLLFYVLGIDAAHRPQTYTGMAVHTATLMALAAGALVFAHPMRDEEHEGRWITASAVLGVLVVAIVLWYGLRVQENVALQRLIDAHAFSMRQEIDKALAEQARTLARMARRWETDGGTPRDKWEADAAALMHDSPGLVRLEWIDTSYIVRWVVPAADAGTLTGLSLESEPWLDATRARAMETAAVQVSPTFPLESGDVGVYLFLPVSALGTPDGFFRATLSARLFLQPMLADEVALGYAVDIDDQDKRPLYRSGTPRGLAGIASDQRIEAGGAQWRLHLTPTPGLMAAARTPLPEATLVAGALLSALLAVAIKLMFDARRQRATVAAGELRLKQSEEKYRGLLESLEYGVFVAQDYRFVFANAALPAMLGYRREDFVDLTFAEVVSPDFLRLFTERYSERVAAGPEPARRYAVQLRTKDDGKQLWVELNAQRTTFGGRPAVLGIVNDISERKRQEAELYVSEQRFRLMVEGVKDYAIYLLDPDGRVATWNAGAERIKGYTAAEVVGQPFSLFFTEEDVAAGKPQQELARATATGRFEEEGWRRRKDGTRFWAGVALTALHDQTGRLAGFAKITRDLTERRQQEKELLETLHKLEVARQSLEERVAERTAELAAARDRIGKFAKDLDANIEAERRRLSREVHDQLGQVFTGLNMSLRASASQLPPRFVADASALLDHGLGVVRKIASELRPPLLDDLGLALALQHLADAHVAAHGIEVAVEVNDDGCLSPDQANQLFRIVQEALTNVVRHAGARHVRVDGAVDEATYRLLIENDGRPFDPVAMRPGAQGITGMRERAGLIGGSFEIMSGENGGTLIAVRFPIGQETGGGT
jgi:PAS domain S-box-containing protein